MYTLLLITSSPLDVTRQALDEIRNLLNSGDVNSTKIAQLLADLVDRLIKEGQLASRDLSVVSIYMYV